MSLCMTVGTGTHPHMNARSSSDAQSVKTTVDLPEEVWRAAKIRAMDDRSDLRTVIIAALRSYLGLSERRGKPQS